MTQPLRVRSTTSQIRSPLSCPSWLVRAIIQAEAADNSGGCPESNPLVRGRFSVAEVEAFGDRVKRRLRLKPPLPGRFFWGQIPEPFNPRWTESEPFLFWLPLELECRDLHLVAASRMKRRLLDDTILVGAFRSVINQMQNGSATLLYSPNLTLASHLRAASRQFNLPLLEVCRIPRRATSNWFTRQAKLSGMPRHSKLYFFRPITSNGLTGDLDGKFPSRAPLEKCFLQAPLPVSEIDWLAVQIAKQIHILSIRPGGNLELSVRHRLRHSTEKSLDVRLLDAPHLTPAWLAAELVDSGAIRWSNIPRGRHGADGRRYAVKNKPSVAVASKPPTVQPEGDFLFHWTRAPALNRDEATDTYFMNQLVSPQMANLRTSGERYESLVNLSNASLLKSLCEILVMMRINSSGRWTRNGQPVVSLSAQPLSRWSELRTFRSHLGRWDFEPCGIALSRKSIIKLKGKPVIYGDEVTYQSLPKSRQGFFQPARSRGKSKPSDWTIEREWRVPGDIDLRIFGVDEAFVFLPNPDAAQIIAPLSRWPVYILSQKTN